MITIRSRKQHMLLLRSIAAVFAVFSAFLFASLPLSGASAKTKLLPKDALDVFIVADTSARFDETAFRTLKSTLNAAVGALPTTARIGVVTYGPWSGAVLVQPAEANRDTIVAQLATTQAQGDRSTLADAISFTVDNFDDTRRVDRLILVVSDGVDKGSSKKPSQVMSEAKAKFVRVGFVVPSIASKDTASLEAYGKAGARIVDIAKPAQLQALIRNSVEDAANNAAKGKPLGFQRDTGLLTRLRNSPVTLFVGGIAVFCAILSAGLALATPSPRKVTFSGGNEPKPKAQQSTMVSGLAEALSNAADATLTRSGKANDLDSKLERADIKLRSGEYLVLWGVAFIVAAALGYLWLGFIGAGILGAVGLFIPKQYLKMKASKRSKAFSAQLVDILLIISSSLRAGQGLVQAFDTVAREGDPPASNEFHQVVVEARLGRDLVESLHSMAARVQCEDFEWVIPAVEINREVGGDLAEVLDTVAQTIRDRQDVARQVKTLSAEGRLSAVVLFLLPIGIAGFLYTSNPEYIGVLFKGDGLYLLGAAGVMMTLGAIWLSKLVKIDY